MTVLKNGMTVMKTEDESMPAMDYLETSECLEALHLSNPVFSQMAGQATLQVDVSATQGVLSYQWHMIQENTLMGLLPLSCYEERGQVRLCWRVTALQPLSMLFTRKKWTVGELLGLVRQFYALLAGMDVLLLDGERLLLDNRYILIDPVHLTLGFAYCPLMETEGSPDAMRQMLLRWVTGECPMSGPDTTGRLADLLLMLQDSSFHWSRLSELFAGLPSDNGPAMPAPDNEEADPLVAVVSRRNENVYARMKPSLDAAPGVKTGPDGMGQVCVSMGERKAAQAGTQRKPFWSPDWRRVVPVQIIVVGSLMAVISGGILTQHGPDGTMARFGMLLLGVALEVWAFSTGRRDPSPASGLCDPKFASGQPACRPSNGLAVTESYSGVERTATHPFARVVSRESGGTPPDVSRAHIPSEEPLIQPDDGGQDETSLLARKEGPFLYHQRDEEPARRIPVTKTPFLIGRLREQVDGWLGHPAVGKMHAEIRLAQGAHCLVDLNSRNGTSVNGVALTPYVPWVLHANDQIRISDETLVFREQ